MRISSIQIDQWADSAHARGQLPELVRRLIGATATLTQLAVRGADTNNFGGWDGMITASAGNAWVPVGDSRWEMGCAQAPLGKARSDFRERTEATPAAQARELVFVFVSPRIWAGKDAWQREAEALGHWRSVRAYDADDLASWLEVAGGVCLWFAESMGLSGPGVSSVVAFWENWRHQTPLPITVAALSTDRARAVEQFGRALADAPALLSLEADSVEEAVAFACGQLDNTGHADVALCVTAVEGWRYVDANAGIRVAVAASTTVAAARARREGVTLIVPSAFGHRARSKESDPAPGTVRIELPRAVMHEFKDALVVMGEAEADASRLAMSCGRSWSVYRRVRAANPAIRTPTWMTDPAARSLSTVVLLGGWNASRRGDVACVEAVTGQPYEAAERDLLHLAHLDDAPVLKIGQVWKAKAPLELLYLFAPRLTGEQKRRLLDTAEAVLAQPDPALDLAPDQRWMASVYGKVRNESGVVIGSIVDSLTKLSVYAESVQDYDLLGDIDRLVARLLGNASSGRWMSLAGCLRELAEASPPEFLRAVEAGLLADPAPLRALFVEHDGEVMFERDFHTHLLWALEILAWSPRNLARVCDALARMMAFPVRKNLSNRPSNSLISLLRPWWPQTTASAHVRLRVLDRLITAHPEATWEILAHCIPSGMEWASANAKPHWRDDDAGAPKANHIDGHYLSEVGERILAQAQGHARRIGLLVSKIDSFEGQYRDRILALMRSAVEFPDGERQIVRDALRHRLSWQLSFNRENAQALAETQSLRTLYDELAPSDLLTRHAWLFQPGWVELPDGHEDDYQAAGAALSQSRTVALAEIFTAYGWRGVERLLAIADPALVGWNLTTLIDAAPTLTDWLIVYLSIHEHPTHDPLTRGVLHGLPADRKDALLHTLVTSEVDGLPLAALSAAPVERATWDLIANLPAATQDAYWRTIQPGAVLREDEEISFVVERLMAVGRARTAFQILQFQEQTVGSARLIEVLAAISGGAEPEGVLPDGHRIARVIDTLVKDDTVPRRAIAALQFRYLGAIELRKGALTLFAEMAKDPNFFMEFATLAFKPRDAEDDRPEVHPSVARNAWQVMHEGRGVPGGAEDGTVDSTLFRAWVAEVRARARESHRLGAVDSTIGTWLSRCPADPDGQWPCLPVRELLEDPTAESIRNGFECGVRNNRGFHSRGILDGGEQERTLADHYRGLAQSLVGSFPNTAECLNEIARSYEHEARWHDDDAEMMREHP
ncbi:MAG: hypothetical protein JNN30_21130 [Rhodanobacteraceae bacterium]|nr:hypothetical protein [Rhodanobacteraceae bacterium]